MIQRRCKAISSNCFASRDGNASSVSSIASCGLTRQIEPRMDVGKSGGRRRIRAPGTRACRSSGLMARINGLSIGIPCKRAAVGPVMIAQSPIRSASAHASRKSTLVTHSGKTIAPRRLCQTPFAMRRIFTRDETPQERSCRFSNTPP